MPFRANVQSNAYYSRFQTKNRRRRIGKTDYFARRKLITQAKNKYAAPKYRLVVRFTNKDIITQIVTAHLEGDRVLYSAYSHELPLYGIKHGLTNWSAAYATGLLLARRALTDLGLNEDFPGVEEPDGEYTLTQATEGDDDTAPRRPFKVFLDVGLARTTTGARVFGAMKGASDGGLYVPHSNSRFPGYDPENKELDADVLRNYIFGGHVAEYMEMLADDDEERYKQIFCKYIEDDIEPEGIEGIYTKAHAAIREDPWKKGEKADKAFWKKESKKYRTEKLNDDQRKERVQKRIVELQQGPE